MKNRWQDRQSEILPDHTAIEDDDAEILNGYRKCVVNPVDCTKELLRVAVRDGENRQLLTSI
jgi:hypothetical protein